MVASAYDFEIIRIQLKISCALSMRDFMILAFRVPPVASGRGLCHIDRVSF